MTDAQFQVCDRKIDAMRRRARRPSDPADMSRDAREAEAIAAWDAVFALPQFSAADRKVRDAAMDAAAVKHGLVTP